VDDRACVAALVSGDPRGLEGAYRSYADRLYTYCRGVLRDSEAAADAVHDTFLLASQRAGQLRDAERFRPWLYAIARNECLRIIRRRGRQVALEEAGEVSAPYTDPASGMQADEVQALVWAAADGLNPGDREVFELAVRHDLPAADVAAALGVSVAHAHARLSRARTQLERALGALLVARTGRDDCPQLDELLAGWDGKLTALVRKRISRHIESCEICGERRRRQLSPAALFSAYAGLPMLVAPREIWHRLQLTSADAEYVEALAERAGRFDSATGFPRPLDVQRRRAAVAGVAAVAVAAVFAFAGGFLIPPTSPASGGLGDSPTVGAPPTGSTESPSSTTTPTTTPTPTPSPTQTPTPDPTPGLTVEVVSADERCEPVTRLAYTLAVRVEANRELRAAALVLSYESGAERHAMEVSGSSAVIQFSQALRELPQTWHVEVISVDDVQASTDPVDACQ
jgi:RNA polymerase sigma factor (sigma-70 family)